MQFMAMSRIGITRDRLWSSYEVAASSLNPLSSNQADGGAVDVLTTNCSCKEMVSACLMPNKSR